MPVWRLFPIPVCLGRKRVRSHFTRRDRRLQLSGRGLADNLDGAILPLLVAHDVAVSGNVGRSVGGLYFANTAGASLGAFAAVGFLFASVGLSGTTHVAAALNALLVVDAGGLFWRSRGRP